MKAGETTLQKLLNTSRQFIVPIFQRNYSWELAQFKQLWLDILRASEFTAGQTHFIGSIVYIDMGTPAGRPQQLSLIDGQQRLTTLSLLLCALKRYILANNIQSNLVKVPKLTNQFLLNSDELGEDRYKLLLNEQDKQTYIKLLEQTDFTLLDKHKSVRIMDCYAFFTEKLTSGKYAVDTIFRGILNLSLVSISLDKNTDNPQLIFESMNSTGKDLSQADLLRNYLLMDLTTTEQNYLYLTYWQPMETAFGQYAYLEKFDYFIRDFLTIKQSKICKISDVYENFKRYYATLAISKEAMLKDLFTYAQYYTAMELGQEQDKDLSKVWQELRYVDSHVTYPLLLQLYRDYTQAKLTKTDFILIIKMVISYIVRRSICELPANSLNKTFATFYAAIDKQDYVNSVRKIFILKDTMRIFPTDYMVREKLQTKDMYHFRLRNYILETLENYHHKEPISISRNKYTIEHIMPQSTDLKLAWQKMLGTNWQEVQKVYLHTLGNLTLTGYNSEMSNKTFDKKVNDPGGFKYSHLKLNAYIATCKVWNKATIKRRTNLLTDLILQIWQYPSFNQK